jgi:hypothetical protein
MVGPGVNRIVVDEFNAYLQTLSRQLGYGISLNKVIKSEASKVLAKTSEKTKKAKASAINKRYTIASSTKTTRKKGPRTQSKELIPYVHIRGKKYSTRGYYSTPLWQEIKAKLLFYKERAKSRIYSGKATWLLVARKARLSTKRFPAINNLQAAISSQGGSYASNQTENGTQNKVPFRFNVKIVNGARCALNKSARGVWALKSAMAGRMGYFRRNMRQGVFNSAGDIARAYPGIEVGE